MRDGCRKVENGAVTNKEVMGERRENAVDAMKK